MTLGDRIAVMSAGRLQQLGAPQEVYDRPVNMFVAGFIGSPPMNLLRGEARAGRLSAEALHLRAGGLRLRHARVETAGSGLDRVGHAGPDGERANGDR